MALTIEEIVDTPGAFMCHCALGPVTDLHIKSGVNDAHDFGTGGRMSGRKRPRSS
jgi:hypothetical protein